MKMPEWLEATDSGTEGKIRGREHFLIRNRSALEAVINSFSSERFELRFLSLHPTTLLLSTFLLIISISLSQKMLYFWVLALVFGSFLIFMPSDKLRKILEKTLLLSVLPFLVYLPALFLGRGTLLFIVRIPLILLVVSLYAELSSLPDFIQALKQLHFPDVLLVQLDITLKYIFTFSQILVDMLKAIEVRSNANAFSFKLGTSIWGILYLKARRYGTDLQKAMEARGFVGHYYASRKKLALKDYLFLLGTLAVLIISL